MGRTVEADCRLVHPFRFGIQCRGPADPAGWRDLARKVEDLGWSALTVADHFDDAMAPIPALMAAADATSSLRVGTMVFANDYRHPVVLAKEAATLDVLTGGRFDLGIGAGWMTTDYEQAGIALDRPGARIERLGEALQVLRGLWSDEPCTFAGDHYEVAALDGHPKPRTRGGPPVVIGGGGRRILELAGREADVVGINVNLAAGVIDRSAFWDGTAEVTDEKVGWVRAAAGDRDPALHVRVHLALVTDDREGIVEQLSSGFGLTPEQARATPHAVVGDVSEICDQLLERRERWGISYLGLSQDQLEPFAPVIARLAGT
jgi:probable F420-dependent oxidoreductase